MTDITLATSAAVDVSLSLDYEFTYEDVTTLAASPVQQIVDLSIPTGAQVTGSGVVVTGVKYSADGSSPAVMTPIDEVPEGVAVYAAGMRWFSGPHPTDSTKWRIQITQEGSDWVVAVRAWMATLGPAAE